MFTTYRHIHCNTEHHLVHGSVSYYIEVDKERGTLRYSVALCSKKDHFCYRDGRRIAKERFGKGNFRECEYNTDISILANIVNDNTSLLASKQHDLFKRGRRLIDDYYEGDYGFYKFQAMLDAFSR